MPYHSPLPRHAPPALDLIGRVNGDSWYTQSVVRTFEMPRLPALAMEAVPEGR
jgi:hypothetical protein